MLLKSNIERRTQLVNGKMPHVSFGWFREMTRQFFLST
jgi:hypothetical protein